MRRSSVRLTLALCALLVAFASVAGAQDRLRQMPGYARWSEMGPRIAASVRSGAVNAQWADDSRSFEYALAGKRYRFDLTTRQASEITAAAAPAPVRRGGPARGRQFTEAWADDSSRKALYRDRNLYIADRDGSNERQVTTDGSAERRIKYGTASWVYGEELDQVTAMWWSPDGSKLAYYRFDESPVPDYVLQTDQTTVQGSAMYEAYPKAGTDNPIVDLYVFDLATGRSTRLDVRDGRPLTDEVVGHYVYNIRWSPDGRELLVNRTNRRQNVLEFAACAPATGACRVVIREEWPTGWVENSPPLTWLADGRRFIWASERTGFRNFYLYDLTGRLIATLTNHEFEVGPVVKVDEAAGQLWYYARSGDNYLKQQLHRVRLNGRNGRRLTDPTYHHTVSVAPNGRHFTDVAQRHDVAPITRLMDANGRPLATVAESDLGGFHEAGFKLVEMMHYTAADGTTDLPLMIHRPSDFDASKRYPVLFSVYAGPATNGARELFTTPNALTEFGFIVVTVDTRAAAGRGKRALDALYLRLGEVEVDDLAAAARRVAALPFVDGARVGIYGTSYGGYASALALLRYPNEFHAASASSAVTSWHHYDTIYTERYMYTPQANPEGYRKGNAMEYVQDLRGRLLIYYGTADDNVHPNNSMQLLRALVAAGKSHDVQVGPDAGHSGINPQRMMEFFIEALAR
ncbi:MAG: DPP IV N-terminal domain-containing protein [Gemmatimonadaceae bacterium]